MDGVSSDGASMSMLMAQHSLHSLHSYDPWMMAMASKNLILEEGEENRGIIGVMPQGSSQDLYIHFWLK